MSAAVRNAGGAGHTGSNSGGRTRGDKKADKEPGLGGTKSPERAAYEEYKTDVSKGGKT